MGRRKKNASPAIDWYPILMGNHCVLDLVG